MLPFVLCRQASLLLLSYRLFLQVLFTRSGRTIFLDYDTSIVLILFYRSRGVDCEFLVPVVVLEIFCSRLLHLPYVVRTSCLGKNDCYGVCSMYHRTSGTR